MVAGGALVARGRVFGKLAVSRALGDSDFKVPIQLRCFSLPSSYDYQL